MLQYYGGCFQMKLIKQRGKCFQITTTASGSRVFLNDWTWLLTLQGN